MPQHQINIDSSMYKEIQNVMKAGRNQFQNSQTRFIDIKSVYVANLGDFWSGMWLGWVGRPKIKVGYPMGTQDDYPIIKSEYAVKAFETGIDSGIKLR